VGGCLGTDSGASGETATIEPTPTGARATDASGGTDGATLQEALDELRENPGGTLDLGDGVYRVEPADRAPGRDEYGGPNHGGFHLLGEALEDVDIVGDGAEIVFTDATRAGILLDDSENLRLSGIRFDWDPLPWSQGSIQSVEDGGRRYEILIDPGHQPLDANTFLDRPSSILGYQFDEHSNLLLSGRGEDTSAHKLLTDFESLGDRRFAVTVDDRSDPHGIAPGRRQVVLVRRGGQVLEVLGATEPVFENLTLYASVGAGIRVGERTERPVFRNVTLEPRPDADRLISTNHDGLMIQNTVRGPVVEDCHFEKVMDANVAMPVFGRQIYDRVDDRTLIVRTVKNATIEPGDTLVGMTPETTTTEPLPAVASVESAPTTSLESEDVPTDGRERGVERIGFAEPVERVAVGDFLLNRDTAHRGFEIRNNTIENARGKGLKVHGFDGVIADNEIDGTPGTGISLEYLFRMNRPRGAMITMWAEDVTIRNNTIRRTALHGFPYGSGPTGAAPAIDTDGRGNLPPDPAGRLNRSIRIEDNTLVYLGQTGMRLEAAQDLEVTGNEIVTPNVLGYAEDDVGIDLRNVGSSQLSGNVVRDTTGEIESAVRVDDESSGIDSANNRLRRE
jgi:hypothetical protein